MVGRGNAGWTTAKSGQPCPCKNCSRRSPAKNKTKQNKQKTAQKKDWKSISVESSVTCPRRPNRPRDCHTERNCRESLVLEQRSSAPLLPSIVSCARGERHRQFYPSSDHNPLSVALILYFRVLSCFCRCFFAFCRHNSRFLPWTV